MLYFVPIFTLALTLVAFFVVAGGRFVQFGRWQRVLRVVLALPLFVSGLGHFVRTALFASIIPLISPHREFLVILTGIFELAGGIGLQLWKTTRMAATCLAVMMIAVFPANIYVANQTVGGIPMPGVLVRTGLQAIYMVLLLASAWGIPHSRES